MNLIKLPLHIKSVRTIFIIASFAGFSLNAMQLPTNQIDEAKRHVDILFSYHPIFDIALTEDDESFDGNLVEFRGYLQYRVEFHSVVENSVFLVALEQDYAKRKAGFLQVIKGQPLYSENERSLFGRRLSLIDKAINDFCISHEILRGGDWDSALPISAGTENHSTSPNPEPLSSKATLLSKIAPFIVAGGLVLTMIALSKGGH